MRELQHERAPWPARTVLLGMVAVVLLAAPTPAYPQSAPASNLTWYGLIKLDASWDSSLITPGNFARWVESPDVFDTHGHFNMTARQTRLGARLRQDSESGLEIDGRIEVDFYGGGAENKNAIQVRHAYVELSWPDRGWSLLAGQSSDVIAPLNPTQINYTVAWWAGNIGYRRPQLRVTKRTTVGEGTLVVEGALSRTIGDDFAPPEPGDSGADSELPTVEGRAGYARPLFGDRALEVGVSSHWGRENLHRATSSEEQEFRSWSVAGDLRLPLGESLLFEGEVWKGTNLDDHFGGVGQGVDHRRGVAVDGYGGWGTLSLAASERVLLAAGYGLDDPDDDVASAGRLRNRAIWATMLWDFAPGLRTGLEISHWDTRFLGIATGRSVRVQTALIYAF